MEPFEKLNGVVAALDRENVDTDQIIPAVYLKRIERTGFGPFLFLGVALPAGWPAQPRLRAEHSRLPRLNHPGHGTQLRQRLLA